MVLLVLLQGETAYATALLPFWNKPQAKPFVPTKWIPKPWRTGQLRQIDALPVLGYLHRPVRVSYLLPNGQPMRRIEREAAFLAGWKSALSTLPDGIKPELLFHNLGPSPMQAAPNNPKPAYEPEWGVPMHLAFTQLGPAFDIMNEGYNLPAMLGEMGAATPMASFDEGRPSAVVLFDKNGATITMVRPPAQNNVPSATRLGISHFGAGFNQVTGIKPRFYV